MHLSLTRIFVILLIYVSPPLIFMAFIFTSIPNHGYYPFDIFFIGFLIGFLAFVAAYPLFIGIFGLWFLLPFLFLYYGVTYGLLISYWKRKDGNNWVPRIAHLG